MKRLFDLGLGLVLLILFAPVMIILVLIVKMKMGCPVIFRQQRPGFQGRPFYLFKFRTMSDARDERGELLSDQARLTKLGELMRKTSLDELPQLINVVRGEISFVGPRPLLMQYLERFNPEQARRHEVKPGITGWAQVNGRNAISWEEKFAFDVWYVDHRSFLLDLKILWLTLLKVVRAEGISGEGSVTMNEFMGNTGGDKPSVTFSGDGK
ncbi:MAG: sugar transferase [Dethiobacteria bacterium]|nr:sugar transferase [Dethiobacteria bacterium]